jgi:hypothetical protein
VLILEAKVVGPALCDVCEDAPGLIAPLFDCVPVTEPVSPGLSDDGFVLAPDIGDCVLAEIVCVVVVVVWQTMTWKKNKNSLI